MSVILAISADVSPGVVLVPGQRPSGESRAGTVNDHPVFVRMLAEVVRGEG